MSGLINIPTARQLDDQDIFIGAALIPKGYFIRTFSSERENFKINPGLNTYITYAILPFVELSFRYTHELNIKVNPSTGYFPDRMFSFKTKILKEQKLLPSIGIGIHDLSPLLGTPTNTNNYFAFYFVGSKKLKFHDFLADLSFGHTINLNSLKSKSVNGVFYGLSLKSTRFKKLNILFEYDSFQYNSALRFDFKHLNLLIGLYDLKMITYSVNIKL